MTIRLLPPVPGTMDTFRTTPLFESMGEPELRRIASFARLVPASDGDIVLREGERADALFLIERGLVRLEHQAMAAFGPVQLLGEGDAFGLSAVVEPHVHVTTAVAVSDAMLWRIPANELRQLLVADPQLRADVLNGACRLLRDRYAAALAGANYWMGRRTA